MSRVSGVDLPPQKRAQIGLTYIYGIGRSRATEILGKRDLAGRPDLGVIETRLFGHKFVRKEATFEKVQIFELDRDVVVKRRSHYA